MNQFAFFPFGIGPRRCIGEGFALMEGVLALGTILRRWEVKLLPETKLVLDPKITLRPRFPVLVNLKPALELGGVPQECGQGSAPSCA